MYPRKGIATLPESAVESDAEHKDGRSRLEPKSGLEEPVERAPAPTQSTLVHSVGHLGWTMGNNGRLVEYHTTPYGDVMRCPVDCTIDEHGYRQGRIEGSWAWWQSSAIRPTFITIESVQSGPWGVPA